MKNSYLEQLKTHELPLHKKTTFTNIWSAAQASMITKRSVSKSDLEVAKKLRIAQPRMTTSRTNNKICMFY